MAIHLQPPREDDMTETSRQEQEIAMPAQLPWRTQCRTVAERAAEAEARREWGLGENEEIPFNYRWEHVQQVVETACWLARITGANVEIAEAAAWLHDVRKVEENHAIAGAAAAREILGKTDFPEQKIEAVCTAIYHHEGLTRAEKAPLEPLDAAVLWDADKLTKLGVQALAYSLMTPRQQGRSLAERLQQAETFTATVLSETVASMSTKPAQALATQRHAEMTAALKAWRRDENLETETRSSF